jgi:hypothetical protein
MVCTAESSFTGTQQSILGLRCDERDDRKQAPPLSNLVYYFPSPPIVSCGILDRVHGLPICTSKKKLGFFLTGNVLVKGSSPTLSLEDFMGIERITVKGSRNPFNTHEILQRESR